MHIYDLFKKGGKFTKLMNCQAWKGILVIPAFRRLNLRQA